jgi:hypothetical protein
MPGSDFHVNVPSGFSNSDVRNLSDTEKGMAGAMGLSEEQFRQSKLEYLLSEERRRNRGRDLGEQVEKILNELGSGYRLTSVTWNRNTLSWRLEIETPQGLQNVVLSSELVDYALDARTRRELQRLRNMVWFGLGRHDLIFEKHE